MVNCKSLGPKKRILGLFSRGPPDGFMTKRVALTRKKRCMNAMNMPELVKVTSATREVVKPGSKFRRKA
jgi:hypothetical protein